MADIAEFGIKIEANTKALDDISKKLDDLTEKVEDSSEKIDDSTDKATKKVSKLAKEVAVFGSQILAIKKITSAVFSFSSEAEGIGRLAKMASVSTDTIQDLGNALRNYGGSASSASSTLSKLSKQMFDLRMGKGGALAKVVMQYGLDTSAKSPEDMLLNIAKRMQGMSALQQVNFGRALGLDEATIMFLQQGVKGVREELEKAKKNRLFSKEDIENAEKFQREIREFEANLRKISIILIRAINPIVKRVIEYLNIAGEELQEHPKLIKGIAIAFGVLLAAISPISLVVAGIALILDDIFTYLRGGDSVLGSLINKFGSLKNLLIYLGALLIAPFTTLTLTLAYLFGEWLGEQFAKLILWITNLDWSSIGDKIKDIFVDTVKKLKDLWTSFMKWLKGDEDTYRNNTLLQDELINHPAASLGAAIVRQTDGWALNGVTPNTMQISNNNAKTNTNSLHIDTLNLQTQADSPRSIFDEIQLELGGVIGNVGVGSF